MCRTYQRQRPQFLDSDVPAKGLPHRARREYPACKCLARRAGGQKPDTWQGSRWTAMLVEGKEDAHELAEELGDSALTFSTIGSLSWVGFATILNILLPLSRHHLEHGQNRSSYSRKMATSKP